MFKKLLSSMTVMLLAFCMNAGAQSLQAHKMSASKITPKYAPAPRTSVLDISSDEMWIGYWSGDLNGQLGLIGMNQTPMQYDVAIGYPAGDAKVKGMEITGLRFTFTNAENVENLRVWMSTTLPATAEEADIICDKVTAITDLQNPDDPMNEIRFSKPYKVDESKPVYIGYSFDINKGQSDAELYPVITDMGVADAEYAMIVKVGGDLGEWMDYNGIGFGVVAIQMLVKGTFPENAISIPTQLPDATGLTNSSEITLHVENAGTNPLSSIKFNVSADGALLSENEYTFETPLVGIGSKADITVNSVMPEKVGAYKLTITVTEVNGEILAEPVQSEMNITVVAEKVTRRPVVEEFTGMWCGWCPRGMVALEKLNGIYGDDISCIAVHVGDKIECYDYAPVSGAVGGFPSANVDRKYLTIDPYYGIGNNDFGINDIIVKANATIPVADVSAAISLEGDIIDATANVKFLYSDDESHYAVGYVLVEDGKKDAEWAQSNYYSDFKGQGIEVIEPLFEPWINGDASVTGVVYDDVAIAAQGILNGVEGSIPAPITEGEERVSTTQFKLADYPAVQNTDNLRLIVILFNTNTGCVENSATARMNVETSVNVVENKNVIETARYAVDGSRISTPQKGINIVKYSDGRIKKVVVR